MRLLKPIYPVAILAMTLLSCGTTKSTTATAQTQTQEIAIITATDSVFAKSAEMDIEAINAWPHADVFTDSLPGMSLAKAYNFVQNKKGTPSW